MPAPAAPRRAGPPRRKAPKSPDAELPTLPSVDAAIAEGEGLDTPRDAAVRDEAKLDADVDAEAGASAEHMHTQEEEREPEPEPEPEEEETEEERAARRKRIAERLAKSGGFNPFAPRPPTPPEGAEEAEAEVDVTEARAADGGEEDLVQEAAEVEAPPEEEATEEAVHSAHPGEHDLAEPEDEAIHVHGQEVATEAEYSAEIGEETTANDDAAVAKPESKSKAATQAKEEDGEEEDAAHGK